MGLIVLLVVLIPLFGGGGFLLRTSVPLLWRRPRPGAADPRFGAFIQGPGVRNRDLPRLHGLVGVRRAQQRQIRKRAKACQLFHRLMRRSVLAQCDAVVGPYIDDVGLAQGRQSDAWPAVLARGAATLRSAAWRDDDNPEGASRAGPEGRGSRRSAASREAPPPRAGSNCRLPRE
jgi:hypothetical protein